jgi:hypothetical protein
MTASMTTIREHDDEGEQAERRAGVQSSGNTDPLLSLATSDMREPPTTQGEARSRLAEIKSQLGWSNADLGRYFSVHRNAVMYWLRGENRMPDHVMSSIPFLEAFAATEEARARKDRQKELMKAGAIFGAVLIASWLRNDD